MVWLDLVLWGEGGGLEDEIGFLVEDDGNDHVGDSDDDDVSEIVTKMSMVQS